MGVTRRRETAQAPDRHCFRTGCFPDSTRKRIILRNASVGPVLLKCGLPNRLAQQKYHRSMPIPDFQSIMLPLLVRLRDGREHANQETLDALGLHFSLTEDERTQLLPSGRQGVFVNRVAWSKNHLKAAGLIESPRRGLYKIASRGTEVLNTNPNRIDLRLLKQFPEYIEFRRAKRELGSSQPSPVLEPVGEADELTPEEHLEYGNQRVREQLAADLLEKLKAVSPSFFETVVVELLVAMGYGGSRQDAG